jgi:phage-related protein
MKPKFEIILLEDVWDFLDNVDEKARDKIFYNFDKSRYVIDSSILKKIDDDIWEFRTLSNKIYYRVFAFWDKTGKTDTLVVATHGIIKKTNKIPKAEIEKTKSIMKFYFEQRRKN